MDRVKLALTLPWSDAAAPTANITSPVEKNFPTATTTLGSFITALGPTAIGVGGVLMFIWAAWGVFDYIRAEGNKEALAKARKRIQWAIAGFMILILAFLLSDFVRNILIGSWTGTITELTDPTK